MKHTLRLALGIGLGFAVSAAAWAQTAFTTKTVNLRAGPSREYPLVAQLPGGTPVEVGGCVDDWSWCDVSVGPDRGWVYAGNLEYPYEGRRVIVMNSRTFIGFPIVPFAVGPYWDTYYRGRPWYGRRTYWIGRPAPVHGPLAIRPAGPRSVVVRPRGSRSVVARPPAVQPRGPRAVAPRPENRSRVQAPRPAPRQPASKPERKSGGEKKHGG